MEKETPKKKLGSLAANNVRVAKQLLSKELESGQLAALRSLTLETGLSLVQGDIRLLEGRWYVTHAGLLRLARRQGCRGIQTRPLREFCDPEARRWVFRAVV